MGAPRRLRTSTLARISSACTTVGDTANDHAALIREVRALVIEIARATVFGCPRILGEIRKLGFKGISRQTVRNILKEEGIEPRTSWYLNGKSSSGDLDRTLPLCQPTPGRSLGWLVGDLRLSLAFSERSSRYCHIPVPSRILNHSKSRTAR